MKSKIRLSVICPVYNGLEYTKKCLNSLYAVINSSIYKDGLEVIVVDDGSIDGTSEWIRKNYPAVIVLNGNGNLWWTGAINLGAKCAFKRGAQYLYLINNDNIFDMNSLDKVLTFSINNNFEIVGSLVMDSSTNQIWSAGGYFNNQTGEFGHYNKLPTQSSAYWPVAHLPGMGTLIRKSVIEKIGFWDDVRLPQYLADSDLTLRAKEAGIGVYVYRESIIWNDAKKSGLLHKNSIKWLMQSLFSIKSYYNILYSYRFLRMHHTTLLGIIRSLFIKYVKYIGGFIKHRLIRIKGTDK